MGKDPKFQEERRSGSYITALKIRHRAEKLEPSRWDAYKHRVGGVEYGSHSEWESSKLCSWSIGVLRETGSFVEYFWKYVTWFWERHIDRDNNKNNDCNRKQVHRQFLTQALTNTPSSSVSGHTEEWITRAIKVRCWHMTYLGQWNVSRSDMCNC